MIKDVSGDVRAWFGHLITYRKSQLVPDLVETIQLALHLGLALLPEAFALCLLERYRSGFLERTNTGETNARVCSRDVLDQVLGSDQIANPPAGSIEKLACATHSQCEGRDLGAQRRNAGEWHVVQLVVYFVGQDEDVVLDAEVANGLQLLSAEDLAHRVVRCVDNDHACPPCDLALQLLHVKRPFASRSGLCCAVGRRV